MKLHGNTVGLTGTVTGPHCQHTVESGGKPRLVLLSIVTPKGKRGRNSAKQWSRM